MEDWDIPEQDDFESRYADELEMLDDLEEEGENQRSLRASFLVFLGGAQESLLSG